MTRRFVNQLGHQEDVDQIFLASDKQLRSNRQGNLYLQVELSDKTGVVGARMWNATEESAQLFDNGDFVRVQGKTQLFQGSVQLIATRITRAQDDEVDPADYQRLTNEGVDQLRQRLVELVGTISSPPLATLAQAYLDDPDFMDSFCRAPAGVKNHHAYQGGLLEHVVQLLNLIDRISDLYPEIDRDLMLVGAFLHDSGKVIELSYERDLAYTDEGQLIGHIVLAVEMLDKKLGPLQQQTETCLPAELVLRVKHMIVSHHGSTEFGSPTVPMTVEAIALHHLDNLDAKIHHFQKLLASDANVDSAWTQYHPNIGRRLYKGKPEGTD